MPELNDAARLAEALCARICHDLSSALCTLGATLELMQVAMTTDAELLGVASDSATALRRGLELFRAAWGAAPGPIALPAIVHLAAGLPRAHKITLDLGALPPDTEFSPASARAVLALLLAAAGALPMGGRIALAGAPDDLVLTIAGAQAAWPSDLAACLRTEAALGAAFSDPMAIAMPLAILAARAGGMEISLLLATGRDNAPPPLRLAVG